MAGTGALQTFRGAAQTVVQVVLVLLLFGTLQFLAGRHNVRFDLTPTQRLSLSPYARQTAEDFSGEGTIRAFYDSQQVADRRRMLDLLDQVQSHARGISYELVDLDRKPGQAKKYGVSNYGSGVLELQDGSRHPLRSITEEAITGTLLRLSRKELGKICFVTGHGESNPRDTNERSGLSKLTQAIQREGFGIDWLVTLGGNGDVDVASCTVLAWVSPTHDLVAGEADVAVRHFREGGRSLFLLDPGSPPSFTDLLARMGIVVGRNVIVDESNRMLGASSFVPQVDRFRPEVFRDRLRAAAILPVAQTMRANPEKNQATRVISLAGTAETTWAYFDTSEVPAQDVQFRPAVDEPGPLSIAVRATAATDNPNAPGIVIAIGDSDFVTNAHLETLGNRDFALAVIGVLAEEASLIGMRQDEGANRERPLTLSAAQTRNIFWLGVVILPGISTALGLGLRTLRRRRLGGR